MSPGGHHIGRRTTRRLRAAHRPAARSKRPGEQQAADTALDAAEAYVQPKPLDPTPKKDFPPREDSNGVIIEKKNGVLITRISAKEVYYLPDEF